MVKVNREILPRQLRNKLMPSAHNITPGVIRAAEDGERPRTHGGGYAHGLSLVAVTVRDDASWVGAERFRRCPRARVYEKYMKVHQGSTAGA